MSKIGFDFGKTIGVTDNIEPYKNSFKILNMIVNKLAQIMFI